MILELYRNRTLRFENTEGMLCARWTVHPMILVGGSINPTHVDACAPHESTMKRYDDDAEHLSHDLGVMTVINAEIEQSDKSKVGPGLSLGEFGVVDNSGVYPAEVLREMIAFAKRSLEFGRIYVHCFAGGGRSSTFAYAILRGALGMSKDEAIDAVRNGKHWKFSWNGEFVNGSITEYPRLEWGQPPLTSASAVAVVEEALR